LLDVVEEQILSLLCVWPGRTPDVIMGALVLRKEALDLALQELEGKRFVSVICARDGDPKTPTLNLDILLPRIAVFPRFQEPLLRHIYRKKN